MRILYPFIAVLALVLIALVGANLPGGQALIGVVLPYVAFLILLGGFVAKILGWAKSPVPFRIPTTCGQEKSLSWIPQNCIDNPSTRGGVVIRMILEIFLFRSLFRNTKTEIHDGPKLVYGSSKYLWLFGLLFHYCFLTIVIRHLRLFTTPVPFFVSVTEYLDGFFQVGLPVLYQTDIIFVLAITFLFLRRVIMPQVRYISLPADYFTLFLIMGIAITGVLMRYFLRVDVVAIKQLALGLATLSPTITGQIGAIFFVHVFLVCALLIYFPFR